MVDQVRIEEKSGEFAIVLVKSEQSHEMDQRPHFEDAKEYALYLARRMKLDVFYKGQKIN